MESQRNVKKMDAFPFHVMMCIQIRARGSGGNSPIFLKLKWCKLAQSECSKIHYYHPKNYNIKVNKSTIVKIICHAFHQYQGRVAYESSKVNTFRFSKGGGWGWGYGGFLSEAEKLKNQMKRRLFI